MKSGAPEFAGIYVVAIGDRCLRSTVLHGVSYLARELVAGQVPGPTGSFAERLLAKANAMPLSAGEHQNLNHHRECLEKNRLRVGQVSNLPANSLHASITQPCNLYKNDRLLVSSIPAFLISAFIREIRGLVTCSASQGTSHSTYITAGPILECAASRDILLDISAIIRHLLVPTLCVGTNSATLCVTQHSNVKNSSFPCSA